MMLGCPVTESMHRQRTRLIRDKLLILQREYRECLTVVWMTLHDPDSTALLRRYMNRLDAYDEVICKIVYHKCENDTDREMLCIIDDYFTASDCPYSDIDVLKFDCDAMSYGLDVLFEKMSHDIMVNCETVLSQAFNEVSLANGHSLIAHIEL